MRIISVIIGPALMTGSFVGFFALARSSARATPYRAISLPAAK